MNSIPQEGEDSVTTVSSPGQLTPYEEARRLRSSHIQNWLAQSPFYEPFRKVTGPFFHWLATPTNSIISVLLLILAPFIALLLLPLFLILIPVFLFFAVLASTACTVKTDAEAEVHESVTHHFMH